MSAVHFNELRAKRDAAAESLRICYFWGHEDWFERLLTGDWGIYGKMLDHLVGNRRWHACEQLDELYTLCQDIAKKEEAAARGIEEAA